NTSQYRDVTASDMIMVPTFNKTFNWFRNYNLSYAITKALKVDFTATDNARVLEPDGLINTQAKKDTIKQNFLNLGATTLYNHQFNANYIIPVNKLPFLDFTKASVKYTGTYNWTRSPVFATQTVPDTLGNTIQNSRVIAWTGELNMITIYNRIPFFKRIIQNGNKRTLVKVKEKKVVPDIKNKGSIVAKDTTKKKPKYVPLSMEYLGRIIMSVKNVGATYSTNDGTILTGYNQLTNMMGMNSQFSGPTVGFVLGSQKDIRNKAIADDWLVKRQSLNTPYVNTHSQTLNLRANVEPLPDLKVEFTAVRTQTKNNSEFFRWRAHDSLANGTFVDHFVHDSPMETGSFSMSFLAFGTSFTNGEKTFENFLGMRSAISTRLGQQNINSQNMINGYADGYNGFSQDVLIPAFVAAYSGKNPDKVGLSAFPAIPLPNWRLTYDGLSKMDLFKTLFKTVTLSHGYHSTYNVGGYTSNMLYTDPNNSGYTGVREGVHVSSDSNNTNFLVKNIITAATISEQWSPLMKVDVTLHNSALVNFAFNKTRDLSLGLTSKTITEVEGQEIVVGTGYKIKNVSLGQNIKIRGKPIKSDLNLIANLSFRKNVTTIRRIDEENSQLTGGSNIISIKLSADYIINDKMNIRFFYDRILNKPVTSNSFATTNTNAGLSLRLSLTN